MYRIVSKKKMQSDDYNRTHFILNIIYSINVSRIIEKKLEEYLGYWLAQE